MQLQKIFIEKCKNIESATLEPKKVTLLIGGNNAGKSCILQAIHFAITTMQSTKDVQDRSGLGAPSTLGNDQFRYRPTDDLFSLLHKGTISQSKGPQISLSLSSDDNATTIDFAIKFRRGKNSNISLNYHSYGPVFALLSDRKKPFSIFAPGLAGIPLREEYKPDFLMNVGIAQGDANLYLRNVLLRIAEVVCTP